MLETRHAELIDYLHNSEAIVVGKGPDSMDELVLANQRDLAVDALNRKAELLSRVSNALLRLGEGSYGICLECGRAIPERFAFMKVLRDPFAHPTESHSPGFGPPIRYESR
jgi:RNA polymerase-binding transcription factor DksA